jgi:hypothetical protein
MAYDHADVITYQASQLEAERLAAANDYESNRLSENHYGVLEAANRYVEIEARIAALDRIAGNFAATAHRQQQQQQRNPCGLSQAATSSRRPATASASCCTR